MRPRLCGLLKTFWAHQKVVPRQNGYHGTAFPATRKTIQGGLVSLPLFNIVVDNIIRTWLDMTVEDQRVAHYGMGEAVGSCPVVFYADDGMVLLRDAEWIHHSMRIPVGLF